MEQYSDDLHQALQKRLAASSLSFLRRLYIYFRQRGGPGRELVAQEITRRKAAQHATVIPLYPTAP